ncbi:hypothetical protein TRAPUB_3417 [Trametes pubescens]|uniref:Uncharacterized protein n=1 Tax=Trametes pubescens TaxID=154538 RepID=A0A1M2W7K8_TRAPU|nr:hypothetical protein TRAPUB_3417 [Trametes pubescens]
MGAPLGNHPYDLPPQTVSAIIPSALRRREKTAGRDSDVIWFPSAGAVHQRGTMGQIRVRRRRDGTRSASSSSKFRRRSRVEDGN